MQYSKLLFVLPLAANAAIVARDEVVEMAYVTDVETAYVTQYGTVPPAAPTEAPAAAPSAQDAGHGHAHVHSYNPAPNYQPPSSWSAPPPPPPPSSYAPPAPVETPSVTPEAPPASTSAPASEPAPSGGDGGSSSGGCPADTSGAHLSPSVDASGNPVGGPGKSMIDSMNYIRRMYNESAACLSWSDSLAQASSQCAGQGNENNCCRANSNVISDMQYGTDGYKGPQASSVFEGAMMMMLCQDSSDPKLDCKGRTGEVSYTGVGSITVPCDSSSSSCTGHRDAIIDAQGTNHFMGVGTAANTGTNGNGYMSCSFSATNNIFD